MRKKKRLGLGTITVIESSARDYCLGAELAQIMERVFIDGRANVRTPWFWRARVISRSPDYSPQRRDGRVIRVDSIANPTENLSKAEVIRRAMLTLRGDENAIL